MECPVSAYGYLCRVNMEYAYRLFVDADTYVHSAVGAKPYMELVLLLYEITHIGICSTCDSVYGRVFICDG